MIFNLALEVMQGALEGYTITAATPPSRHYISPGPPADDCPQLTVRLVRTFNGLPGNEVGKPEECGYARSAQFEVRVSRCLETSQQSGEPATPATLQAASKLLLEDAAALYYGMIRAYAAKTFLTRCQAVKFGNITTYGPSGNMAAVLLPVEVQLD